MAEAQQRVLIKIPNRLTPNQRLAVATEVINHIIERTRRGLDKNGRPFKRYSQVYKDSQDFDIAGKSSSNVNLIFTGEMINSIELLNHGSGFITIGMPRNSDINDKAAWNKENGREFLGIEQKQLDRIIRRIDAGTENETNEIIEVPTLTQRILERIRGN